MHSLLLAFGWFPELKGITVVVIAVATLIGGAYLIVATNVGARLGLMVVLAGFFGWMASMGVIWWCYGIGLKGRDPSWKPKEIITADLAQARYDVARDPNLLQATIKDRVFGWVRLADDNPGRGQAVASADEIVQSAGVFKAASADGPFYLPTAVYDKGGGKWPNKRIHNIKVFGTKFGNADLDWVAFFHHPHYALVELKPTVQQKTEPGKAPPTAVIDTTQPARYVLMIRDLGSRRQPAAFISIGSSILFGLLCVRLNARDRVVAANRSGTSAVPAATAAD
jgi:hypothetical protein